MKIQQKHQTEKELITDQIEKVEEQSVTKILLTPEEVLVKIMKVVKILQRTF